MAHLYPILLDVSRRNILIVGGGAVAARKASALIAAGAKTNLRAVAPKFVREFPGDLPRKIAAFEPADIEGADLVFAATDSSATNDGVVAEARRRKILVQRGDEDSEEPGDFISPAILRSGPIIVAVSAGGSPALAAGLRDTLAGSVTDDWVNLAGALQILRPKIKAAGLPITRRREIFRTLATSEAAAQLQSGGFSGLCDWLRQKFSDLPALDHPPTGAR